MMSGAIEAGNKLIANTGKIAFYGKQRSNGSRLRESVYSDENSAIVEPGLDWGPGDELYFAPTNMQWGHSEYHTIAAYDI